jgi:ribosomal protein S18 acetylase RimI-like enzyme
VSDQQPNGYPHNSVWVRFDWNLSDLGASPPVPLGYNFGTAIEAEAQIVMAVVIAAYESDPIWAPIMDGIRQRMSARVREMVGAPETAIIVARRAGTIVGVSGVAKQHWTEQNLLTGLCVLPQHQRRGIGTCLLYKSLVELRRFRLPVATVYTEENSIADRKLYPKFGSTRHLGVEYPALRARPSETKGD